jgi:hypothetical protein
VKSTAVDVNGGDRLAGVACRGERAHDVDPVQHSSAQQVAQQVRVVREHQLGHVDFGGGGMDARAVLSVVHTAP